MNNTSDHLAGQSHSQPDRNGGDLAGSGAPRVALLTGACGGIGRSTAELLASQVDRLVLCGRSDERLQQLIDQLTVTVTERRAQFDRLVFDLSDATAVDAAIRELFRRHKRLDLLVNAAGIMYESALMMTRPEMQQQTFAVNTFGALYLAQFASRLMMRGGGGAIVNISSVVAEQGAIGQSVYSASKSALEGMTCSLAKELAPHGIRVNCVAPGFIETELVDHYSEQQRRELAAKTALGRLGRAEDVAAVIAFLCGEGASYITGQTIAVDGMIRL